MKGGKCSSCSCGRKTQSAGGSGCGRKHSGGGKNMNHTQHGAGSKNNMVGGKCSKNHKGGACSKNHKGGAYGKLYGGFSAPFPGDNKKELDAIPTLVTHPNSSNCKSKCGGGKKTKKGKRVSNKSNKKSNKNKRRSIKKGGSSKEMACPSFDFDLKDQIRGRPVVTRIDSCRS